MKITVHFKTPDAVHYAIQDHVDSCGLDEDGDYSELIGNLEQKISKFVDYGECVSIEFDTEAGTATVLEK